MSNFWTLPLTVPIIVVQSRVVLLRARLAAHGRLTIVARADLFAHAVRCLAIVGLVFVATPFGAVGPLLAWLAMVCLQLHLYRSGTALPEPRRGEGARRKILDFIRPLWPNYGYHVIGGLAPILALGWFGQLRDVAEFGALSRLGQIFAVIGAINPYVVQPLIAGGSRESYPKRAAGIVAILALGTGTAVLSGFIAPEIWLFVLGHAYVHLTAEVGPFLLGSALTMLAGTIYYVTLASTVTSLQGVAVVSGLVTQILFVALHPLEDLGDAIAFVIFTALTAVLAQSALLFRAIRQVRREVRSRTS